MDSKDVRRLIRKSDLYLWQIADEIGISDPTITRWLRRLDGEKTEKILKAVDKLSKQVECRN